jgi:sugar phosphate isomerase/epimerase
MKNRRSFLKHAGALALGTLIFPACNTQNTSKEAGTENEAAGGSASDSANAETAKTATGNLGAIGLQLYSVKDVLEKDLKGTLQQLADIGYKEAESYPGTKGHYYGMEAKAFGDMLRDMGITLVSSHVGSGNKDSKPGAWQQATLMQNFSELTAKAAETGQKYITCSSLDGSLRKTTDDLKRVAELFNKSGETAKKAGLQFAYHNHAFEFEKVGNVMVYDYLLQNTDPELVKYEMDLFWVVNGGQDPLAYFKKYPNRFPLCHVKDMSKEDKTKNTEVGSGTINYKQILKAAKDAGMKHYLVEQESFTRPSIESMRINYNYLANLTV